MTIDEFSNEFDILLNSYPSIGQQGITLNEYEKSVFLTNAQAKLVQGLYTGNITGDSFEVDEKLRRYLDELVIEAELDCYNNRDEDFKYYYYKTPKDLWYIVQEKTIISNNPFCPEKQNHTLDVIPIRHDEWNTIRKNPFKRPNNRRVLRLDYNKQDSSIELISKYDINKYIIRYLRKPKPIILTHLDTGLSIDNETVSMPCELNSVLHKTILELAVKLAKQIYAN